MQFENEASRDFLSSLESISTLLEFAKNEEDKNNGSNRALFLKLSVVHLVTRFQVFVESVLKEFENKLKEKNFLVKKLPIHMKLNSLRILSSDFQLHKKLVNMEAYSQEKYQNIGNHINALRKHYESGIIDDCIKINTAFPLGKTGSNELIQLFRQIEGWNIFDTNTVDMNILDGILLKRHLIIHQDRDPSLTDNEVSTYKNYLITMCQYIDNYLANVYKNLQNTG
jgi:hypothetical protein